MNCPGTITQVDSSRFVPSGCQDLSYVCTGGCTPVGRLVVNYGNCCAAKTCADYPGKCGILASGCGSGTINCSASCSAGTVCQADAQVCATVVLKAKNSGGIASILGVPATAAIDPQYDSGLRVKKGATVYTVLATTSTVNNSGVLVKSGGAIKKLRKQ